MVKLLHHIPTKFGAKFPSPFQSSSFDWQLLIEVPKFEANLWTIIHLQQTSQIIACQKFCEMYCKSKI